MATASRPGPSRGGEEKEKDDKTFECNICLDTAEDAVVSLCGHLFCWPCLHQWLETKPSKQTCPVCKAAISKEKVIPLYGRGTTKEEDPRNKVPPRPTGQRAEADNGAFPAVSFGEGNFRMSFGIGAFPFALFTSSISFGEPRAGVSPRGAPQHRDEQFITKIFLWVASLFILWLLLA